MVSVQEWIWCIRSRNASGASETSLPLISNHSLTTKIFSLAVIYTAAKSFWCSQAFNLTLMTLWLIWLISCSCANKSRVAHNTGKNEGRGRRTWHSSTTGGKIMWVPISYFETRFKLFLRWKWSHTNFWKFLSQTHYSAGMSSCWQTWDWLKEIAQLF